MLLKKLLLILSTVTYFNVYAQLSGGGTVVVPPTLNDSVINSFKATDNEFYFEGLWNLNAVTFLENHLHLLNITPTCGLELMDIQKDDSTFHYWFKFQQLHNNYKVENRTVLFVEKGGKLLNITGNLSSNFKGDDGGSIIIDDSTARSLAFDYAHTELGIDTFAWEIPQLEENVKIRTNDSNATYYPNNPMVLYTAEDESENPTFILAYYVTVFNSKDLDPYAIYVDASTGDIIKSRRNVFECGQIGTANIHYNGARNINTHYRGFMYYDYSLQHCSMEGTHIKTIRSQRWPFQTNMVLLNPTNTWGDTHQNYTSVHWWASMAREYFHYKHNKKFMYEVDEVLPILQTKEEQAFHNSSYQYIDWVPSMCGIEIGTRPDATSTTFGTLDVVGHEYAHGIIYWSTKLHESKEAKTIHEGFSDIYGNLVEHYALGSVNWAVSDTWYPIRNAQSPNSTGNPRQLFGNYWVSYIFGNSIEDDDNIIHHNSTIISHWFYLLQDKIGIDKAARIAFRISNSYANSTTSFWQFRGVAMRAAADLFGECSMEVKHTNDALNEVNLFPNTLEGCVSITGPGPSFCNTELEVPVNYTFYAQTNAGAVSYWTISASGANYTTSGNSINITRFNSNMVSITATAHLVGGGTRTLTELVYFRNCPVGPLYYYGYLGQHTIWPADKYGFDPEMGEMPPSDNMQQDFGKLQVYPNPTEKTLSLFIDNKANISMNIQVTDVLGRVVKRATIENGAHIDVSDLSTGVYSVKAHIMSDKGETTVYSAKFVKN